MVLIWSLDLEDAACERNSNNIFENQDDHSTCNQDISAVGSDPACIMHHKVKNIGSQ